MSRYMRKQAAYTELVKLASAAAVIRKYRRWEKMASGGSNAGNTGANAAESVPPAAVTPPSTGQQDLGQPGAGAEASAAATPDAPATTPNNGPQPPQRTWGAWAVSPGGIGTLAGAGFGGLLGVASGGGVLGGLLGTGLGGGVGYGVGTYLDSPAIREGSTNTNGPEANTYYEYTGKLGKNMTVLDWFLEQQYGRNWMSPTTAAGLYPDAYYAGIQRRLGGPKAVQGLPQEGAQGGQ